MFKVAASKRIAAGLLLMALSAVPYATVYVLERTFGAPSPWLSAVWPTVAAPVLVGALLAVILIREHSPRSVRLPAFDR